MGESKRRRRLDPNYGKPIIRGIAIEETLKILSGKADVAIVKADQILPEIFQEIDQEFGTRHHCIIPVVAQENLARQYFIDNKRLVMDAVEPLAQEHGKGWICQIYVASTDITEFGYNPANKNNLEALETKVFTRGLGKSVGTIMRSHLNRWCWNNFVPILAMSTDDNAPSWIYVA